MEIYERADGEHAEPCAEVDEAFECRLGGRRAFDAGRVERKSCGHAEDAELVPREEDVEEMQADLSAPAVIPMLEIVILRHWKDGEDKHERLEDPHDLRVGKSLLAVENEGADTAEGRDVGHHGIGKVGAAVEGIVVLADKERPADDAREEDDEDAVDRDQGEIP